MRNSTVMGNTHLSSISHKPYACHSIQINDNFCNSTKMF